MKPETIRTSLKRMWLEDFARFCNENLIGESNSMMRELLAFEADFKTM